MQLNNTVFGSWQIGKPIGTGAYGKVYEIHNSEGEKEAYKIMKMPIVIDKNECVFPVKTQEERYKEIRRDILSSIKFIQMNDGGKHFVSYKECYFKPSEDYKTMTVGIRMERLISLSEIIRATCLTEEEIIRLAVNICRCLEKCRGMEYVYVNLKPDNIFITETGVKLGDFGNFGVYEPANMNIAMRKSQEYEAPETVKFGEINNTVDTYSLGLLMYGLLNNNRLPFISRFSDKIGINDIQLAIDKRCANYIFPDPDNGSKKLIAVISKACNPSVNNRFETPTEMKNELLALLGEKAEENPFVREENPDYETIASPKTENTVGGNVATFGYTEKIKKKKMNKTKKILLISILAVFLALIIFVFFYIKDAVTTDYAPLPTEELRIVFESFIRHG